MSGPKVVVTGAAGFLGRLLCAALQRGGARVLAVDLADAAGPWDEMVAVDLTEPDAHGGLYRGIATVYHLAAKTHDTSAGPGDEAAYRRLNVEMTRLVTDQALAQGASGLVLMSSVKVLGEGGAVPGRPEDEPCPASAYGRTKLEAERIVHEAGRSGLQAAVLRAPLIYGPGVKGNLQAMIAALAAGRFPPPPDTGNRRSLVDVRDVVAALVLLGTDPRAAGRTWQVTDGCEYSTFHICALIRQALGRKSQFWAIPDAIFRGAAACGQTLRRCGLPAPFDQATYHKLLGSALYDGSALTAELGFEPAHTLETALPEMVRPYR